MGTPVIRHVRAFTVRGGGADYHDQGKEHWIDDHIATPMARYPEYRQSRQSFGINVLGTLVVEIEASDGTVGFAVTTGGEIGAFIVEKHLARFLEGQRVTDIEKMWDQMYFATLYYGRKGVVRLFSLSLDSHHHHLFLLLLLLLLLPRLCQGHQGLLLGRGRGCCRLRRRLSWCARTLGSSNRVSPRRCTLCRGGRSRRSSCCPTSTPT
jgi:hypothetical protein